jgi:hypothetical protein
MDRARFAGYCGEGIRTPGVVGRRGALVMAAAVLSRLPAAPAQKPACRHNWRPHKTGMIMTNAPEVILLFRDAEFTSALGAA